MKPSRRAAENKRAPLQPGPPLEVRSRQSPHNEILRSVVAIAAAKLIAEGLADHGAAKQKAARKLGVTNSRSLPNNQEIEVALREHLALFKGDTQPRVLQALRAVALQLMRALAPYSPKLVGSVLTGTATEFSEIELELIGVEAKEFEMYLLNKGVEFQLSTQLHHASKKPNCETISYQFMFAEVPVGVTLFENHATRLSMQPRDCRQIDQADYAEAEKRFAVASSKNEL